MKLSKKKVLKIIRKVNREMELEQGRVSYNRIHVPKKIYRRQDNKKAEQDLS